MSKSIKVVYPTGCKEVNEELGKDELVKRLKVRLVCSHRTTSEDMPLCSHPIDDAIFGLGFH